MYSTAMNGVGTYSQFLVEYVETQCNPVKAVLVKVSVQGAPRHCDKCDLHIHEGECTVADKFWNRNRSYRDQWIHDKDDLPHLNS